MNPNRSRPHLLGMVAGLFLATGLVLSAVNNTSSADKTITAVVTATYSLR